MDSFHALNPSKRGEITPPRSSSTGSARSSAASFDQAGSLTPSDVTAGVTRIAEPNRSFDSNISELEGRGVIVYTDCPGGGTVSECQDPLVFADPVVEAEVRSVAGVPSEPLSAAAVAYVGELWLTGATDLDGVQCLPLSIVNLTSGLPSDLAPLGASATLHTLSVFSTELTDLARWLR